MSKLKKIMKALNQKPVDRMFSYNIYKDEFDAAFIEYLKSKEQSYWIFKKEETEKVLTIVTWESNIPYIQSMMFKPFC